MYTFRMVLIALFATLFLVAASCDDQTVGDEEPTDGSVGEVVEGDAANDATAGDAATDTESTDGSVDSSVSDAEVSTEDMAATIRLFGATQTQRTKLYLYRYLQ